MEQEVDEYERRKEEILSEKTHSMSATRDDYLKNKPSLEEFPEDAFNELPRDNHFGRTQR